MQVLFDELEPRLMSPRLWKGFAPPVNGVFPATSSGNPVIGLFDDFVGFGATCPLSTSTTYFQSNGITYLGYNDTTVVPTAPAVPTTTPAADENGPGVIVLQADTTDNDSAIIQAGSGTMMPFHVIPSRMQELVFETRFKVSAITTACTDLFIGLGGTGACANSGVQTDDSATLASNNFLGFVRKGAATSGLTLTYQRVSGTEATKADVGTLVADTYIKAGFRYHASRKQLSIWIDGEEVTASRVSSTITGATPWPTLYMNFLAEMKYQATASHTLSIDWWACAQML
jgi:hypothetical protein